MKKYTVIGFYSDTRQRFATTVEATGPDHAETEAYTYVTPEEAKMLCICGVIEGFHALVDANPFVTNFPPETTHTNT